MDVLSHGLWGGGIFGQRSKRSFWTAFLFGIGPDFFSFGIFSGMILLGQVSGPDWSGGPPDPNMVPQYIHTLYNITHSLFVFVLIFAFVFCLRKKPMYEMLAWPLHILMDIPTHSTKFFPTPFLWPLFDYRVDGIPWSHPWIFFPNWILLIVLYLYFFVYKKRKSI